MLSPATIFLARPVLAIDDQATYWRFDGGAVVRLEGRFEKSRLMQNLDGKM
jgi:hypothetical protein